MNLHKLTKKFGFLLVLLVVLAGSTFAQTTFYVNRDIGSDGRDGSQATLLVPDDGVTGPKLTVTDAMNGAVDGDIISVAYSALNKYAEGDITVTKELTFTSTGAGTPVFTGGLIINQVAAGDDVEFIGPFHFEADGVANLGLDMQVGDLTGADNLTIEESVHLLNDTWTLSGQLNYVGVINFEYENTTAAAIDFVTGDEFPVTASTGVVTNLDLTKTGAGAVTLELNEDKTINGVLTTAGAVDLGTNTLFIAGNSVAHAIGGDVTNGTVDFDLDGGNATITGAFDLDNLVVGSTETPAVARTLAVNTVVEINNVTANNNVVTDLNNTGDILGNLTNNSSGDMTTANDGDIVGNVTLTGAGNITLDAAGANASDIGGNILVSGTGTLTWNDGVLDNINAINVGGNVDLTTQVDVSAAGNETGLALITFIDVPVVVTGDVTNSFDITGTTENAGDNDNDNGIILFETDASGDVTLGNVVNESTNNVVVDGGSTSDNNGIIEFDFDAAGAGGGATFTAKDITNSSSASNVASASGNIQFSGTTVDPIVVEDVLNTSNTTIAASGLIDFGGTATGDFTANSITTSGSTDGGNIIITDGTVTIVRNPSATGTVTNSRTVAGADIVFGLGTTAIQGSLINSGAALISFDATANPVTVTYAIQSSGAGNITFASIGGGISANSVSLTGSGDILAVAHTGSFTASTTTVNGTGAVLDLSASHTVAPSFGVLTITDGTLDATAATGVDFSTNSFTMDGGTLNLTGVNAGADEDLLVANGFSLTGGTVVLTDIQNITVSGTSLVYGGVSTNPTVTLGGATTAIVFDEPIPNVLQTMTIGDNFPEWPGDLNVANPANISTVVRFTGGNLTVLEDVTFNTNSVLNAIQIDGAKIYIGDNNQPATGGTFANTTGYTTVNDGRVVMSGSQAQQVTHGGGAVVFGGFEVDNNAGTAGPANADVYIGAQATNEANAVFDDFFYLAEGSVEGADISFNGALPYPTIVRNNGTFLVEPTWVSKVNITYIGTEKTTASEVPTTVTVLNNMTIQTTNHTAGGAQAGYGVVSLGANAQVNGTLTVKEKQTLDLNTFDLTLAGSTVVLTGDIAGAAGDKVILAATAGTTIDGAGYLPNVEVANGSVGNVITENIAGLVDDLLNGDNDRNNNDDTTPDASITYAGGGAVAGDASDLTITFPALAAAPAPQYHFANLTMADEFETFTLGSNAAMMGDATFHGTTDLGTFTLQHQGTAPTFDGTSTVGNGTLEFVTTATDIQVTTSAATVAANVIFDVPETAAAPNSNGTVTFDVGNAGQNSLTITGNVTLQDDATSNDNNGTTVEIGNGKTLTLAGTNVDVAANSNFTVTGGAGVGTGLLVLNVAVPNTLLTYTTAANTSVANLEVADDVTLAGAVVGSDLTVYNFTHSDGLLTFGTADLVVTNLFDRTGDGTYNGDGVLLIDNTVPVANFKHANFASPTNMVINNLEFEAGITMQNAGAQLIVVENLTIDNVDVDNQVAASASLITVGDATTVPTVKAIGAGADVSSNQLTFANANADFVFEGAAFTVATNIWPEASTADGMVARDVTVDMVAAGTVLTLTDSRYIGGDLDLLDGVLTWDNPDVLEIASGSTIKRVNGMLDRNANANAVVGTLTAPLVNLEYQGAYDTDIEYSLPLEVNNFELLTAASVIDIVSPRSTVGVTPSIDGVVTLALGSGINVDANTTFTQVLTIPDGSLVDVGANVVAPASATATFPAGIIISPDAGAVAPLGGNLTVTNGLANVTAAGITNNGMINNNEVITTVGGLTMGTSAVYTGTGTDVLNADSLVTAGTVNLEDGSAINMTGNAVLGGALDFNAAAVAANLVFATLTTSGNLNITGTVANGNNLDVVFNALDADQDVTIPTAGVTVHDFTMNQTSAVVPPNVTKNIVEVTGGNLVIDGTLNLTRGILDAGDNNVSVNLTVNGAGIITGTGVNRALAHPTHISHVVGNLGVNIPVASIGRIEWPVGATNGDYRPVAITFTAGNATITGTRLSVGHVDGEPAGIKGLPVDGGFKYNVVPPVENQIGGKAPYSWSISATPSLGASQAYDLELVGTEFARPFQEVNDLRIIKRFDGEVTANAWFLHGSNDNYTNILEENNPTPDDTLITVRNVGSTGGLVPQKGFFTIGIPTQAPIFTTVPANAVVAEADSVDAQFVAEDQDAIASAILYSVEAVTPVIPDSTYSIDETGKLTFKPNYDLGSVAGTMYEFTVKATKATDSLSFVTVMDTITVTDVNRVPVAGVVPSDTSFVAEGSTQSWILAATDMDIDNGGFVYALQTVVPATGDITLVGDSLAFAPAYGTDGNSYEVTLRITDVPVGGALFVDTTLTFVVSNTNRAPVMVEMADTTVDEGATLELNFAANTTEPDGDAVTFAFSLTKGGVVVADSGAIAAGVYTWVPKYNQAGIYELVVTATDDSLLAVKDTVMVTVNDLNVAPVWVAVLPTQTVYVGDTLTFNYDAEDLDMDALTYAFVGNFPADATLDAATGEFSWAPKTASTFPVLIKVSVTDGITTINTQAEITIEVTTVEVAGVVTYENAGTDPIKDATVKLMQGSVVVDSTTTDSTGAYKFTEVNGGEYSIMVSSEAVWPTSAVLASDALLAARSSVDTTVMLTDMQKLAGDVTDDTAVNAFDALKILQRVVKMVDKFAVADWQFETKAAFTVGTSNVNKDFLAIAAGDVNKSYTMAGALAKENVTVVEEEALRIAPKAEFELPIKLDAVSEVSAFTFRLAYQSDKMELVSVASKAQGLMSSAKDGVISLAWADLSGNKALVLEDDAVVVLTFKATEEFAKSETAGLTLELGEVVNKLGKDVSANISLQGAEIAIPENFALNQNYPNPFNPTTTIAYDMPIAGKVTLKVFNTLGQEVSTIVNEVREAGTHKAIFNATNMASGIYFFNITVEGTKNFVQTKKMVLLK
ncbi:MAG: T9SS type A sorting domain-containing protein [Melioribacteraceae bacterium]|nr:T9SS type A sorting domain-containing protein [Melioribacteraceae bacterium]